MVGRVGEAVVFHRESAVTTQMRRNRLVVFYSSAFLPFLLENPSQPIIAFCGKIPGLQPVECQRLDMAEVAIRTEQQLVRSKYANNSLYYKEQCIGNEL